MTADIPHPAVVVLVGAAGSGKSTWAGAHFASNQVVSSDALRAVLGSGPADLEASAEAFVLLDQIVAVRLRRGLTVVIDTLGLEADRRLGYLALARAAGLPAVCVVLDTPAAVCRSRNAERDRPVPARILTEQLRQLRAVAGGLAEEGWDEVRLVRGTPAEPAPAEPAAPSASRPATIGRSAPGGGPRVLLQVSRFPWGADPRSWLTDLARAADALGFAGLALMDHLIQIPQVDRAWEPIPEPWTTLGLLAGLDTDLALGTLVSPVTFRSAGVIAKTAATLDVLSGGRAFCGLGAGWWLREHQGYGIDFPPARERLDQLSRTIATVRALWAPGTKPFHLLDPTGDGLHLPETTCYPRPIGPLPIIVGGSGERRTLRIVAEQADAANLRTDPALPHKIEVLRAHCAAVGRDPTTVEVTVLDVPVVGRDADDVSRRVERLRGRTSAAAFAAQHHAGVAADHVRRYRQLAELGVSSVFVALPDLAGAEDLTRLEPVLAALR